MYRARRAERDGNVSREGSGKSRDGRASAEMFFSSRRDSCVKRFPACVTTAGQRRCIIILSTRRRIGKSKSDFLENRLRYRDRLRSTPSPEIDGYQSKGRDRKRERGERRMATGWRSNVYMYAEIALNFEGGMRARYILVHKKVRNL